MHTKCLKTSQLTLTHSTWLDNNQEDTQPRRTLVHEYAGVKNYVQLDHETMVKNRH